MLVGKIIKKIRQDKGISIRELACKTNLSIGFISNVERDINSPSISSLSKICKALEINLFNLFESTNEQEKVVTRKNERQVIINSKESKTTYELLCINHKNLKPVLISMEPGGSYGGDPVGHRGDEFGIIIEGIMEISVNSETYILEKGDSIYIEAFAPHSYRNIGESKCVSIWVTESKSDD